MASFFVRNKDDESHQKIDAHSSGSKNTNIITDEPATSGRDTEKYIETVSNIIINSPPRFTVGIYGGEGTGKTSLMLMIQNRLDNHENILTVWFDAWRYQDKKSILRAIALTLYASGRSKKRKWQAVKGYIQDFAGATSINLGILNINLGRMRSLKADDVFYSELGDQLQIELVKLWEEDPSYRIVVFVNDLHKCVPEKALELVESMRSFLDINGIIYVLGIDPMSIDPHLKIKYGEDYKIDRTEYLRKIAQLMSYTIPLRNPLRFSDMITRMIKETRLPKNVKDKVLDTKMQELIMKATDLKPHYVKRFINSIVISQEIYGQINDIEKIIVIQAFYFHGDRWVEFLKLLIPYEQRIEFGMHFILWLEKESTTISNLYDLNKILQGGQIQEKDDYVYKFLEDKSLLDIYKKLIDIGDNDLFKFLRVSIRTLLRIDIIEKYLRVVDPTGLTSIVEEGFSEIDNEKQLDLLRNRQVSEFNNYIKQGIPIHLPCENLAELDLRDFRLDQSMLFKANLSGAILSQVSLSNANLSGANLYKANLSGAILHKANLYYANLYKANLSQANLSQANLSGAILSDANLSEADLPGTNLSNAKFSGANLSGAFLYKVDLSGANIRKVDLSGANIRKVDLSGANMSGVKLLKTVIIDCKFSDAVIDTDTDFSDAIVDDPNFLNELRKKGLRNVPNDIRNKQELREKLLQRGLKEKEKDKIEFYLGLSRLPER